MPAGPRRLALLIATACCAASLVAPALARAATLYGASGGTGAGFSDPGTNTGELYTIDPATGATTDIGPIGFGITGLAVDPTTGILYGSTTNKSTNGPKSLVTINKTTGAGTLVGALGTGIGAAADIAFDASGQLWGWEENPDSQLLMIDKSTGAATAIPNAGNTVDTFADGMSFASDGTLYGMFDGDADTSSLYTVDPATGALTAKTHLSNSPTGGIDGIPAASFACDGTTLYAIDGLVGTTTADLVTVDTTTGVISNIGATADSTDGLAFDCSAAPSGGGAGGSPSPPIVTAISPATGPVGTSVGVTGDNFNTVTRVLFGSAPATFVTDGFTHLTATAPAGVTGTVDVRVVNGNGTSAVTAADRFTYTAPPTTGSGTPPKAKCPLVPKLMNRTIRGARKYMDRDGCNVSLKLANQLPRKHHKRRRVISQTPAAGSSTDGAVTITLGYLKGI